MGEEEKGCSGVAQKVKGREVNGFFKVKCLEKNLEKPHPTESIFFCLSFFKKVLKTFPPLPLLGQSWQLLFFLGLTPTLSPIYTRAPKPNSC